MKANAMKKMYQMKIFNECGKFASALFDSNIFNQYIEFLKDPKESLFIDSVDNQVTVIGVDLLRKSAILFVEVSS